MRDQPDPSRNSPFRRLSVLGVAFVLAILSCGKDVTGPLADAARYVRGLAFDPVFPAVFQAAGGAGSGVVQFSKVRVVLHHSDGTLALDTTINFPAGADSLTVDLTVKLLNSAPVDGEQMTLNLGYINAAGDTVFRGGPVTVTAAPPPPGGGSNPVVKIPVSYTGPGANATSVVIAPRTQSVVAGGAFSFTATAKDAGGNAITAPIIWNSTDPSIASLTSAAAGAGTAHALRGTARIVAQLFSGAADTVQLLVTLPASTIAIQSGNGQTGIVGTSLTQPIVVKVTATDGIAVQGTTVNFVVSTGGGSVANASVVSDASGLAQTTWQLGAGVGPQSVVATSGTLSGSPLTFNATAQAAIATKLVVTTQPANGVAGIALGPVVVTAQDNLGNIASTYNGPITLAFGTNTPLATLSGTTTVNAVAGVATFSSLLINKNGSAYTLVASASGLLGATTVPFDIAVGAPAKLTFTVQPSSGIANVAMNPSIVVTAQDSQGNTTPSFTGAITLGFAANPAGGTLSGTLSVNAVAGVATFPGIKVSTAGSGYSLSASATALAPATSTLFNVGTGVATQMAISSGSGQTAPPSTALAQPVVVLVTDAASNPVSGATVNFAVLTGGGSVVPVSGVSDAAGHVQTSWTLGAPLGAQTMSATSVGLTGSPLTINATAGFNAATQLVFTTQPSNTVAAQNIAPAIVVSARDALGALAGGFVGNVTLALGANPGGSTIGGTVTVAAVAGVATFNSVNLNKSGVGYTLTATSGALPVATSTTFNITAGLATTIAVSAGQSQVASVSTLLPTPLAVLVTDANANPVAGTTVNWAVTGGGGGVAPASSVTNAAGIATTAWTLGATAGGQTVSATSAGLGGSPLTFTATGTLPLANKTWTGATSTAWATATNWSPAGAPVATDSVLVPVTGNNPTLAASTTIASLTVSSGAVLTLSGGAVTLTDNGTLDVSGTILGGGNVSLAGGVPRTLRGTIGAALAIAGPYSLNGTTIITGNTAINAGGALTINGQTMSVAGTFSTTGTGTLAMTNAADVLGLTGNASFGGGNETGLLTQGNITITGNFTQTGATTSFIATATHSTIFSGAVNQTITFGSPGPSGFGAVSFANSAGATFASNVVSNGLFTIATGIVSGPTFALTSNGGFNDPLGGLQLSTISFTGGAPAVAGSTPAITPLSGAITFNSATTLQGNLTVNGTLNVNSAAGVLTLNGHTLKTTANFVAQTGATLVMTQGVDSLLIAGNASFLGGAETGLLTNGFLDVKGDFSGGSGGQFDASGSHTTQFSGNVSQNIGWSTPAANIGFKNVLFNHDHPRVFTSDVFIGGTVQIFSSDTSNTITSGGHRVTLGGNNNGVLDQSVFQNAWQVSATNFAISAGSISFVPNLGAVDTTIFSGGGNFSLPFSETWRTVIADNNTSVKLNGHSLNTQGHALITQNGGTLNMTTVGDSLLVGSGATGGAFFNGGSETGLLTKGDIVMGGGSLYQGYDPSFTPTGGSATAFAPSGTKVEIQSGLTVAFFNPGSGAGFSHFWYVQPQSTNPVVLKSDVFVDSLLAGDFTNVVFNSDALGATVRSITAKGVNNSGTVSMTMGAVGFTLNDGFTSTFFQSIVWNNFPAAYGGVLFTLNRSANPVPTVGFQNYSTVTFSAAGQFIKNLGTLPITLASSNTPATCNAVLLVTNGTCK